MNKLHLEDCFILSIHLYRNRQYVTCTIELWDRFGSSRTIGQTRGHVNLLIKCELSQPLDGEHIKMLAEPSNHARVVFTRMLFEA